MKAERASTRPSTSVTVTHSVRIPRPVAQHAAGRRSMDVDTVVRPRVAGRNHVGLAVHGKAYVADKAFVQNRVDLRPVVDAAFGQTLYLCTFGG